MVLPHDPGWVFTTTLQGVRRPFHAIGRTRRMRRYTGSYTADARIGEEVLSIPQEFECANLQEIGKVLAKFLSLYPRVLYLTILSSIFQRRTVLSTEADASCRRSGENATALTRALRPPQMSTAEPLSPHSRRRRSCLLKRMLVAGRQVKMSQRSPSPVKIHFLANSSYLRIPHPEGFII